jgi:hypothetical protein
MGWDTSNAEIAFGANVGISSEVVTFTQLANIRSGNAQLGNLATANFITGTLTTASQPNITSVGTLSSLATTGNVSIGGNLSVTAKSNLGSVSNVIITGGVANYVLSTDGAGNLSWVEQTGGNNSLQAYSDNFTGNGVQNTFTLSTTPANINLVTVNYNGEILIRDSYSLSGANIIFTEPPANAAQIEITTLTGSGGGGGGSSTSISNGNSNVNIATANGNITMSAAGNANILVVTGTGVNVAGTGNFTGSLTAANATLGNLVTANFVSGTLTTAAQPNITSLGTLSALTATGNISAGNFIGNLANGNSDIAIPAANGNINFDVAGNSNVVVVTGNGLVVNRISNLGPVGNVIITGGTNGQVLTTNGSGGLSWTTVSGGGGGSSISNGNSNVNIPAANGNVNISSAGNANILVITGTGANIAGTLGISGNANVGNLGATEGVFTGNLSVTGGINDTGANFYTIGYREVPQVAKSSNYTLENYDNGKHVYYTGSGSTLTIPADGSTTGGNFPIGTILTVVNNSSGNININTSVTLNQAGTANTGNRILATKGLASIMKVDSNTWFISGVGIS